MAQLRRAIDSDHVAHAYLFAGPPGCGKSTTARALAAAMNCTARPGHGCGDCEACTKIDGDIHPDVRTLERQGAARIIPIDTIRREVLATVGMPPHEGRARFFLIEEAAAMQGPAANALLKTLEEPPARTHFVLGTSARDSLLPTIRSRCQTVSFQALPADVRAELSEGDEAAERLSELAEALASTAAGRGDLHGVAAAASKEKGRVGDLLALVASRLHQDAVAAAVRGERADASRLSSQAQLVAETQLAVDIHNAHGQLALEDLLYRLRDVHP